MTNYINTIATGEKQYQIQSFDTLDKDNIINEAYNKAVKVADNLDVSDYLGDNTKEASLTIGNNRVSLQKL